MNAAPEKSGGSLLRRLVERLLVLIGALGLTTALFLVLPLMQMISQTAPEDMTLRTLDTAELPPPPPPLEEEPEEEEPEPEEQPPELDEQAAPLDLSQLELALNPGFSEGWLGGDFAVKLNTAAAGGQQGEVDALFSVADLDQKPRVSYQPSPVLTPELRRKAPGTVHILFVVNQDGLVESPLVQRSSDPVFEKSALNAVKQWKFEPGKRKGQAVRFRMRVPITFPEG
ncbi:MAG: energy transducer TonB [Planctomycetota bacterium]